MGSSVILPPQGQPVIGPDPHFISATTPNLVTFAFEKLEPPPSTYIQRDDRLHVKVLNSAPAANVIVSARMLMPQGPQPGQPDNPASTLQEAAQFRGWVNVIQQSFLPDATRTANEFDLPLAEGYLLSVAASGGPSGPILQRGTTYATIGLQRGPAAGFRFMNLIADYVEQNMDTAWPGGTIRAATEGPGLRHSIQQANPAAGADWTFTAAAGQRVALTSFSAVLTASATVANRNVEIVIDDGVNIVWRVSVQASITAGQSVAVSASQSSQPTGIVTTDLTVLIPPGVVLAPGWRVRTATTGIQAGDQWSAIWLNVEEWINM